MFNVETYKHTHAHARTHVFMFNVDTDKHAQTHAHGLDLEDDKDEIVVGTVERLNPFSPV